MYSTVNNQYDFEAHQVKYFRGSEFELDKIKLRPWYSSGEYMLASLAFHLFNDYHDKKVTPTDIFDGGANYVALMAISLRFNLEIQIPDFID